MDIGRTVEMETLEGKVLAVDASIWMTQFLKAMRDRETGAVLPGAHLKGFFFRLCTLRRYGIRPIFVFDGATPEIKRRELAKRRKHRNQFVVKHGPDAIKRAAKKLLLTQLKKSKAKTAVSDTKQVKITANGNHQNATTTNNHNNRNNKDDNSGAFVAGFHLPDCEQPTKNNTEETTDKSNNHSNNNNNDDIKQVIDVDANNNYFEMTEDGVILTGVSKRKPAIQQEMTEEESGIQNENDWDKPIPEEEEEQDESEDDNEHEEKQEQNSDNEVVEYDDVLWNRPRSKKRRKATTTTQRRKLKEDELIDIDFVSSLSPTERKQAIEAAQKQQRMRSRREFMPVAAKAEDYSQAQLRNFLRSSKLNKDIVKMAKKAVHRDSKLYGEVTAADRTRRVIFQKDDDEDDDKDARMKKRLWSGQSSSSSDDDDDGNDSEEDSEKGGGFLSNNRTRPTNAQRLLAKKQQYPGETTSPRHKLRKFQASYPHANNTHNNSDESDNEGGGFFPNYPAKENEAENNSSRQPQDSKRPFIESVDDSDDSDAGGGFMPAKASDGGLVDREEKAACAARKEKPLKLARKKLVLSDSEDSEEEEGGFIRSTKKPLKKSTEIMSAYAQKAASSRVGGIFREDGDGDDNSSQEGGGFLRGEPIKNADQLKSTGLDSEVIVIDEDSNNHGKANRTSTATKESSRRAQELQDQMLAKALQEEEDAEAAAGLYHNEEDGMREPDSIDPVDTVTTATTGSSIKPTARGPLTVEASGGDAPNDPSSMFVTGGEIDSEEDDIEWENGDAEEGVGSDKGEEKKANEDHDVRPKSHAYESIQNPLATELAHQVKPHFSPEKQIQSEDINDSEREDIDWEDGDGKQKEEQQTNGGPDTVEKQGSKESDVAIEKDKKKSDTISVEDPDSENDDQEDPVVDSKKASGRGIDDFGGDYSVNNAAAFQQAEATASNLTNWAGRAVRRAIAEYSLEDSAAQHGSEAEKPKSSPTRWENGKASDDDSMRDSDLIVLEEGSNKNKSGSRFDDNEENYLVFNETKTQEADQVLRDYESELGSVNRDNVERETDTITDEMQAEVMQLLQLFGIPYIQAPAEAEAQCVELERLGLVSGIVTEDSDVFVFGGKTVYRNIFKEQRFVEVYKADDAANEMGLGRNEMVALAMLLGGDYTEGVKGVGIVNGLEIVTSFDFAQDVKTGLLKFGEWLDGFEPFVDANARKDTGAKELTKEQKFHIEHRKARTSWVAPESFPSDSVILAYTNPVVDKSDARFSWGVPDTENIVAFCGKAIGWPEEETRRKLEAAERDDSKYRQTRIDSFMRYEDNIKFAYVKSKRLQSALRAVREGKKEATFFEEAQPSPAYKGSTRKERSVTGAKGPKASKSGRKVESKASSSGTKRKRARPANKSSK